MIYRKNYRNNILLIIIKKIMIISINSIIDYNNKSNIKYKIELFFIIIKIIILL